MAERRTRPWGWYALAILLVIVDQAVKYLVRANMSIREVIPLIPWLVELCYVENTGAAFSILSQYTWLLTAISTVAAGFLAACLWKGWFVDGWFSKLSVSLILAGAVGNLIDRAFRGAVTDMFNFTFMTFGIFNVADMCVVVGVIAFAACLIRGPKPPRDGGEEVHEADAAGE